MSDDTKINFSVEIKERHVAAAVISAIAHGIKKNMFQDKIREYVSMAMTEFFGDNPDLQAKLSKAFGDEVDRRVRSALHEVMRQSDRYIAEKLAGKVWCETHGAVDPVLGCAVCQQDEPGEERP